MKTFLHVILASGAFAAYPAWNALTWTHRLEAAATDTIVRPTVAHQVIEVQGFTSESRVIVDLAMSERGTVALQDIDDPTNYTGYTTASGPVCDTPQAAYRHWVVTLGFYDECLLREAMAQPDTALILRLLHDHAFHEGGWGAGFVVWRRYPVAPMEADDAWMVEPAERTGGRETLLGRAVASELRREDGRPDLFYRPEFAEFGERSRWHFAQRIAFYDLPDEKRLAFRGAWPPIRPPYEPVDRLSYAQLERALGHPFHGHWRQAAEPDAIRTMGFAETLIFSGTKPQTTWGSNMLSSVMSWAAQPDTPHGDLRRQVQTRGVEIGMRVLEDWPEELGYHLLLGIMSNVSADQMQALFVRLAEAVFVDGRAGMLHFHQAQTFFAKMTGPFPPHVCDAGREVLEDDEARANHQFVLCR